MKEEVIGELTPAQLVYMLSIASWFRPVAFDSFVPVKSVKFNGYSLVVDSITVNHPSVFLVEYGKIVVTEPYIRREQKSKVDGGGWREIPSTRVIFRFVDENFIRLAKEASAYRKEQERQRKEDRERQEVARKAAEAKQREKNEQKRLARGFQFLASLNEKYKGKKLADQQPVKLEEQTLTLQFEDGDILKVDLYDSGDNWYYRSSHLIVNEISAESFEAEK